MTETASTGPGEMPVAVPFIPWWAVLIQGIIALVLGILFLTYPYSTLLALVTFLGAYWFVNGIFALLSLGSDKTNLGWKVFLGIMGIVAGVLVLVYPYYSAIIVPSIFVIMIAVWGVIMGFVSLFMAFKGGGWGSGILGALIVIFGFIILVNPLVTVLMLPYILGAFGIMGGVVAIIYSVMEKGKIPG